MPAFDTKPQVERSEPAQSSSGSEGPPDDGFGDLNGPAIDRPAERKIIEGGNDGSKGGPPDDGFGDLSGPAIDRPSEQKEQSDASSGRPQEPG